MAQDEEAPVSVHVERVIVVRSNDEARRMEPRIMYLSSIDQRFGAYQRNLLVFESNEDLERVASRLESAMAELLVSHDFFSGRFQRNHSSRKFEIRCDDSGALLAIAGADVPVAALKSSTSFDSHYFFYFPINAACLEELPMLTIQVTGLSGSTGFAIGVLCHHAITDATSGINFLFNLASMAHTGSLVFHPNADRTVFQPRNPPRPSFPHDEFVRHADLDSGRYALTLESAIAKPKIAAPRAPSEIKHRKAFHFSFQTLAALKNRALDGAIADGPHSLPHGCTTFEALAAHLWWHTARFSGKNPDTTSRLRFVIDIRRTVDPPLDSSFVGNAIYWANAEIRHRDLLEEPLCAAVIAIQRARSKITDEYLRSGRDFLEQNPDFWYSSSNCDVAINAWPRSMLGARDLDFGWGKPCRAVFPLDPETSTVMFIPVDGGIDVSLCLLPHQMPLFDAFVPS